MSIEVQIAHPCPHLILEEVVTLGEDRRTLGTRSPIASSNVARILANDEVYIPSSGLFSQAQIVGTVAGPYRIQKCDTTLTVTSSTETATVELPVGSRVEPARVVALLQQVLADVAVEVVQGHLVLTDTSRIGPESRILVGGTAAGALGFTGQRGAKGRQVYPGWDLLGRQDIITNRFPRFREPVRGHPVLKMSYATVPERCLRCGGRYVENDYRFNLQGEPLLIENENLLYQAALKILLTRIQSNPFHTFYGSAIESRIGAKAIGAVATLITEDVQNALGAMQRLQTAQTKYQRVTAKERLLAISSVRVTPQASDPTVFKVDVVVTNAAGTPISITIVFTVPGVVALAGTNGLTLGLEPTGLTRAESARIFR